MNSMSKFVASLHDLIIKRLQNLESKLRSEHDFRNISRVNSLLSDVQRFSEQTNLRAELRDAKISIQALNEQLEQEKVNVDFATRTRDSAFRKIADVRKAWTVDIMARRERMFVEEGFGIPLEELGKQYPLIADLLKQHGDKQLGTCQDPLCGEISPLVETFNRRNSGETWKVCAWGCKCS